MPKGVFTRKRKPIGDRYWPKVIRSDGCWDWSGCKHPFGYGMLQREIGVTALAHRVSWEIHFGEVPDGLWVLHHCDNPPCTNPEHLFLGTIHDNLTDMRSKGRNVNVRGEDGKFVRVA